MDYVFICVPYQQLIIILLYLFLQIIGSGLCVYLCILSTVNNNIIIFVLQIIGSGLCVYLCTLSTVDNNIIIFVFTDNW